MTARKRWKDVEAMAEQTLPSAPSYRRNDGSINLHVFKADYLATPEECATVMGELDELRDSFRSKLRQMRMNASSGGEHMPPEIYHATMNLWNMAKAARSRVQDRRGMLRRKIAIAQSDAHNAGRERGFVNAAKRVLSKEQYLAIWAIVDEESCAEKSDYA